MDAELLSTYNFLMAAVAQTFAALVALTAMFYIYRLGRTQATMKTVADRMRRVYARSLIIHGASIGIESGLDRESAIDAQYSHLLGILDGMLAILICEPFTDDGVGESAVADKSLPFALEYLCYSVFLSKKRKQILWPIGLASGVVATALLFLAIGKPLFSLTYQDFPSASIALFFIAIEVPFAFVTLVITFLNIASLLKEGDCSVKTRTEAADLRLIAKLRAEEKTETQQASKKKHKTKEA